MSTLVIMSQDGSSSAERVGARIRAIRKAKDISMAELGEQIGLNADRVQKYETGFRKPREDILEKIAQALGVSIQALSDPLNETYEGSMYSLFEMEDRYGVSFHDSDIGGTAISFKDDDMGNYLHLWRDRHQTYIEESKMAYNEKERQQCRLAYDNWRWSFPGFRTADESIRVLREQKKRLEAKLLELEQELLRLEQPSL